MRVEIDELENMLIRLAEAHAPSSSVNRDEALKHLGTVRVIRRAWENSQPSTPIPMDRNR